jgi:hypothetical protein
MQASDTRYRENELLEWWSIDQGQTRTKRIVSYIGPNGKDRAIVGFGFSPEGQIRRHDVSLRELRRIPTPNQPPLYHLDYPRPYTAPQPPSTQQLAGQLTRARQALAEAHADVGTASDAVAEAAELCDRARKEHNAATGQLLQLQAVLDTERIKLERSIRQGETPPPPQSPGLDRAAIVQRVAATEAIVAKLAKEHQDAEARLREANTVVRQCSLRILSLRFDGECEQLRQLQETLLRKRADLLQVSMFYPSASDGPLKISEASAILLTAPIDTDRCKHMSNIGVQQPWRDLLERLIGGDHEADLVTNGSEEPAVAAA